MFFNGQNSSFWTVAADMTGVENLAIFCWWTVGGALFQCQNHGICLASDSCLAVAGLPVWCPLGAGSVSLKMLVANGQCFRDRTNTEPTDGLLSQVVPSRCVCGACFGTTLFCPDPVE